MDKIWWNEQWMGWPIGPEYAASSNVDNAKNLKGDLLLIYGEMDTNVDPSSTMQVVNQLIKNDKNFDLLGSPARTTPRAAPTAITSAGTSSCSTCSRDTAAVGRRRRRRPTPRPTRRRTKTNRIR
jgi:hypothetical protein